MDILADIALTMVPKCGPKHISKLINLFGSANNIFNTPRSILIEQAGLDYNTANFIASKASFVSAENEIKFLRHNNINAITPDDNRYPHRLAACDIYPHLIYTKGDTDLNSKHFVSVVGTRKITDYGIRMCENIVGEIAELVPDAVIVSGLAFGTDITAHKAALRAGIKTVSVMGRNLQSIYPAAHTNWANNIVAQGGMLISEYNSTQSPDKSSFIQRNRIIAGICDALIVVESAASGGSMSTARAADQMNRDIFAVPGRVGDKYSEGTNAIIANQMGRIARSGQDVVSAMLWEAGDIAHPKQQNIFNSMIETLDPMSQKVYQHISYDPTHVDFLANICKVEQSELASILFELQLNGIIRALSGNRFTRI